MNAFDWARLEDLFEQASAMPRNARDAFLDEACADSGDLRRELAELVDSGEADRPLALERFVVDQAETTDEADPRIGTTVGPWLLLGTRARRHGDGLSRRARRRSSKRTDRRRSSSRDGVCSIPTAMERFRTERQVAGAACEHPAHRQP